MWSLAVVSILCAALAAALSCGSPAPDSDSSSTDGVGLPRALDDREAKAMLLSRLDDLPPEVERLLEPWHGDLDGMVERRLVRVLTVFNPMLYFLDGADQRGIVYEAARELEKSLNREHRRGRLGVSVILIPVTRDALIPALLDGRGDIAAANLTVTPERLEVVDFSEPVLRDVSEIVVTGPSAPPALRTLEDLAGLDLRLRRSSSYWASVEGLNASLSTAGKPPVRLIPVSDWIEDHGLLELVHTGVLPMTVVDSHKARFWAQFFGDLRVREDLAVREGGEIAWAFRKSSPKLAEAINAFVRKHRKGTLFGNVLFKRYLEDNRWVADTLDSQGELRFHEMADLFRKYAEQYDLDWLLIAAQAYQESRLDQSLRSRAGAVGVMQLMPATARAVGFADVTGVDDNVHAGVKYLRHVMDEYFADEDLDPAQRQLLALAAYNAGPTRVRQLRRKAEPAGLDPDVWFQNVEVLAARHVSAEPVRYVSNIVKYYVAYHMIAQQMEAQVRGTK
jgi:membrane-bound lytic murein transglycosylase MltF